MPSIILVNRANHLIWILTGPVGIFEYLMIVHGSYYIQTNIFEGDTQNPIRYREVRFLEKKNGDWKIVYLASRKFIVL